MKMRGPKLRSRLQKFNLVMQLAIQETGMIVWILNMAHYVFFQYFGDVVAQFQAGNKPRSRWSLQRIEK